MDSYNNSLAKYLLSALAIAITYLAFVFVGRAFSYDNSFVAAFWPAAGFAWFVLVHKGYRFWPAIWIGAFLGDFLLVEAAPPTPWVAIPTATASVLQALVGAAIKNRFYRNYLPLVPSYRHLFSLLLVAGPATCLIAPTLGISISHLVSPMSEESVMVDWFTWWVGDTLGFLMVGPVLYCWRSKGNEVSAREIFWMFAILVASVVLLTGGLWLLQKEEHQELYAKHEADVNEIFENILLSDLSTLNILYAVGAFVALDADVKVERLALFVQGLLKVDGITGVGWVPRVPHAAREAFESQYGGIFDLTATGEEKAAGLEAEYYPLAINQSLTSEAERDVGLNLASRPYCNQAMQKSLDLDKPVATQVLSYSRSGKAIIHVFLPVYQSEAERELPGAMRSQGLRGFVLTELTVEDLLAPLIKHMQGEKWQFRLLDLTSSVDKALLAGSDTRFDAVDLRREYTFAGRKWLLEVDFSPSLWQAGYSRTRLIYMLFEVVVCLLLVGVALSSLSYNGNIKRQVRLKTELLVKARIHLDDAMDMAGMVAWEWDPVTESYAFSHQINALLGLTQESGSECRISSQGYLDNFCHPDDREQVEKIIREVQRQQGKDEPVEILHRLICKDGLVRHVKLHFRLLRDAAGQLDKIQGAMLDVTRLVEITEQLESSRKQLASFNKDLESLVKNRTADLAQQHMLNSAILENVSDAVIAYDVGGNFLLNNKVARELLPPELANLKLDELQNHIQLYSAGKPIAAENDWPLANILTVKEVNNLYLQVCLRDCRKPIVLNIKRLYLNKNEHVRAVVCLQDVTEREYHQRRFRQLFEYAPDATLLLDGDGFVEQANQRVVDIFGWHLDELVGQSVHQIAPIDIKAVANNLADDQSNKITDNSSVRFVRQNVVAQHKSRSSFPVDISLSRLNVDAGEVFVCTMRDVSERMASQQIALEAFVMLNAMGDAAFIFDEDTLRFTFVNEGAIEQLGYSREELLAMTPVDIKPEFNYKTFKAMVDSIRATPFKSHRFSTVHRHKNGRDVPVEIVLQYMNSDYGPSRFVALVRDITQRVKIEQQREQFQQLLLLAQSLAHLGYMTWDLESNKMTWSKELCHILGVDHEHVRPSMSAYIDRIYPDDRAAVKEKINNCLVNREEVALGKRIQRPDGVVRHVQSFTKTVGSREAGNLKLVTAYLDVTEQKDTENKLRENASLLRSMGQRLVEVQEIERKHISSELHDQIGQNLTAMSMSLAILEGRLHHMDDESKYRFKDMKTLIDETIASAESVLNELRPPLLEDLGLENSLRGYAYNLSKRAELQIDFHVEGEPKRLTPKVELSLFRIVQEALSNVIKHAAATCANVSLQWQSGLLHLSVSDNGVGFDYQTVQEKNRFGLAIMKERAMAVGADIIVSSSVAGTTIELTLRGPV